MQIIGDRFQQQTSYEYGSLPEASMDWDRQPETYKVYPNAPQIALGPPHVEQSKPLFEALAERRSVRAFGGDPITREELSTLLWSAQGITRRQGRFAFRTAPSAGALYPIETYLAVHRVKGIDPGIYHYAVQDHALELLTAGDQREKVSRAALDQKIAHSADVVFILSAVFARSKWKYGQRAYRYIYLDAGHLAQNLALGAVALELGSCHIGALYDDLSNALLGIDAEHEGVIYMTAIGRPHTRSGSL